MSKFSATLLLIVCFSAALVSTQAADLPFSKFCNEQQGTCNDTCGNMIKEFICNPVTGITTTPCTCVDGATKPAVDPPTTPVAATNDASATSSPAPAGETTATPTAGAAATPSPAPSSAARAAGSVVALGFVAAAMLF